MTKPSASSATAPRLCPTCGTRVGAAATKCLVCGSDLTAKGGARPGVRAAALPARGAAIRLPGGLYLVLLLVVLAAAGGGIYLAWTGVFKPPEALITATPTITPSNTPQPTFTPTATATETPAPTDTPLPPVEYVVQSNDTCLAIAAEYEVSVQSIVFLNGLDPNCTLSVGRTLLIPQPTPTPTPYPTATLGSVVSTQAPRTTYTVQSGDTLAGIARFYGVTTADLMDVNGITDPNSIRAGQILIIPLERVVTPGPTPTASPPPPWPAPNQLLPNNGQTFGPGEPVTLQWTAVGNLRTNEYYYVVVEDVTCNCARIYREATVDTKLIVPDSLRPEDGLVHIYFWTVTTVRQRPTTGGPAEYDPAGATSPIRAFSWAGGAAATPAP